MSAVLHGWNGKAALVVLVQEADTRVSNSLIPGDLAQVAQMAASAVGEAGPLRLYVEHLVL